MASRNILVTGAFGVLGDAVSTAFVANGDKVARIDYADSLSTKQGCSDFGGVDLSNSKAAVDTFQAVTKALGPPDVLVNIAGGFTWETIEDSTPESWSRMFSINAMTCLNMIRATLPALGSRNNARIINIGAFGAQSAAAGMAPYAASKAAVHKITEALAAELKDGPCTVNAILPSIIDTPTNRADMPDADFSTFVKPEAIADIVLFLASPAARAISGALIPVSRSGE